MRYVRGFMLATWPVAVLCSLFAYTLGQSSVRKTTTVQSGTPYYDGVFYGECAWDGEPWHSRQFCATDATKDKHGYPLP
jgi:hypothetical protein